MVYILLQWSIHHAYTGDSMTGWVKIHRKIDSWEWRTCPKTFSVFIYLLTNAAHKSFSLKGIELTEGQILTGRKKLALCTGLTEQNIRTVLQRLKSTNEITIKAYTKYSVITICRWEDYQPSTVELTNNQPTTNQQLTTYKNVKNVKNVKNNTYAFDFDLAYSLYPRKVGKQSGLIACSRKIKTQSAYDNFIKAIKNYVTRINSEGTEQRYIKHFSSFVNCHEDYIELPQSEIPADLQLIYSCICGSIPLGSLPAKEKDHLDKLGGFDSLKNRTDFEVRRLLKL